MHCRTDEYAIRHAKNIAAWKLGIVAYSTSGDADVGDYDEQPTILFRSGRLPPSFAE